MSYDAAPDLDRPGEGGDGGNVLRIDGSYMYGVGATLNDLKDIKPNSKATEVGFDLLIANSHLDVLLHKSVFHLKTSLQSGEALSKAVKEASDFLSAGLNSSPAEDKVLAWRAYSITAALEKFEAVLRAELALADLYLVTVKGGYDTKALIERGEVLFPSDLVPKVPETLTDCRAAGRCIAFELPTAAAFHLHRANEIVLHRYYDRVTGGKPHPESRSIRSYIDAMKGQRVGDRKVISALASLNSLHRNPVIHPRENLESVEEAVALLGSVHAVMVHMLRKLSPPPLELTPPAGAVSAITNEKDEQKAIAPAANG